MGRKSNRTRVTQKIRPAATPGRYINLFVCIPSLGIWQSKFGYSLALMTSYFSTVRMPGYAGQKLSLAMVESSMLCASRENLVKKSLQQGATHILFLDCDMEFPPETVHRLLQHEKQFICAGYPTRSEPCYPIACDFNGKKVNSFERSGIEKIQHAGFGMVLIDTECIKQLRPPLFLMDWLPALGSYCGEDVYFSQKMAEIGVDLWIDHDLSKDVRHIGRKIYGFENVDSTALIEHNATLG